MLREDQNIFYKFLRGQSSIDTQNLLPMKNVEIDRCLEVYRRGYVARLTEALGETFEATWWVLGDEDFFKVSSEFIQSYESKSFDLSDFGIEFPEFISKSEYCENAPFLKDLANFEWVFKDVFHRTNIQIDSKFLQNEIAVNRETHFKLSDSAQLFKSTYSIHEIWKLRRENIDELGEVNFASPEQLVIYRKQSQVFVKHLNATEFSVLANLAKGFTIAQAIEVLSQDTELTAQSVQELFSTIGSLGVLETEKTNEG